MALFPSRYTYHCRINKKYSIMNNMLTGAVDIIENDILNRLQGNSSSSDFKAGTNPLSALVERGYYYDNPEDEEKLLNELFVNYNKKLKKRPVKVVFCPTYICNLNCTYCFEKKLNKNKSKFLGRDELTAAFAAIDNFIKTKYEIGTIELFGGEPLLPRTKETVKKIIDYSVENKIRISIITNGVNAGDFIDILYPAKSLIDMLQITVDGPEIIHNKRRRFYTGRGSFDKIMASIEVLLKNKINTNVRVNVDMENAGCLTDLYNFVKSRGWLEHPNFKIQLSKVTDHSTSECIYPISEDYVLLEKLIEVYDAIPELEKLFKLYMFKPLRHILDITNGAENVAPRYYNCEANLIELFIFCPDGYIYTCPESIGNPEVAIGRYLPQFEIFDEKRSKWTTRSIMSLEKCRNCKFAPVCGGGCPYESMLIHKDNLHPSCENFQQVLDTFFKHRGETILQKFL